jgi:hypothetical protein
MAMDGASEGIGVCGRRDGRGVAFGNGDSVEAVSLSKCGV